MRKIIIAVGLELYAIALALMRLQMGLVTDEAKYLLNIPYPHPPLIRAAMHATSLMPLHELFWRVVMATLVVQAVWLIAKTAKDLGRSPILPCILWLASSAVILYGESVLLVVPTALFGLLFAILAIDSRIKISPAVIGLFWLAALFTTYQSVLYGPLLWMALWRRKVSFAETVLVLGGPVFLLGLYSLSNPLALARMVGTAEKDAGLTIVDRLHAFAILWAQAGGIILSILGTVGILRSKNLGLLGAFALLSVYVLLSNSSYYALLFTPLLAIGVLFLPKKMFDFPSDVVKDFRGAVYKTWYICALVAVSLYATWLWFPGIKPNLARETGEALHAMNLDPELPVFMEGSFGHEWQYYLSPHAVHRALREHPELSILLCLDTCTPEQTKGMESFPLPPIPSSWIRTTISERE